MNLKAKIHLENQKKVTDEKLAGRKVALKAKGLDNAAIKHDSLVKKMKADIRKFNYRLSCVAAQEKLNADKIQTKAEKLAAQKEAKDKPPAKTAKAAPPKKEKKEKKEKKKAAPPADGQE